MSSCAPRCKVAIMGMSANPPTGDAGHLGIVKYFVQTHLFSEIWVLPVYQHMFSEKKSLELYDHRMEMCRISMEPESSPHCVVRVLPIEKEAYEYYNNADRKETMKVATVNVLDMLGQKYGESHVFHLVLGGDSYNDLIARKWKESDRLLSMVRIEVISRAGVEDKSPEGLGDIDSPQETKRIFHRSIPWLTDISSSKVRSMRPFLFSVWPLILYEDLYNSLHPKVYHYIKRNRLYMFSPAYFARRTLFGVLGLSSLFVLLSSYVSSSQKKGFVNTVLDTMKNK